MKGDDKARKAVLKEILGQSKKALMAKGKSKKEASEAIDDDDNGDEKPEADEEKQECPMCGHKY